MNLILLTGLLFILFASLTESFQLRERYFETNSIKQKQLNFWWHKFQLLERTFAIGFGIALATLNSLTEMVVALFLIASIGLSNVLYNSSTCVSVRILDKNNLMLDSLLKSKSSRLNFTL